MTAHILVICQSNDPIIFKGAINFAVTAAILNQKVSLLFTAGSLKLLSDQNFMVDQQPAINDLTDFGVNRIYADETQSDNPGFSPSFELLSQKAVTELIATHSKIVSY